MSSPVFPDDGEQRAREVTLAALFVIVLVAFAGLVAAVLASMFGAWS